MTYISCYTRCYPHGHTCSTFYLATVDVDLYSREPGRELRKDTKIRTNDLFIVHFTVELYKNRSHRICICIYLIYLVCRIIFVIITFTFITSISLLIVSAISHRIWSCNNWQGYSQLMLCQRSRRII